MATAYIMGDLVHSAQMQTYYRTGGNVEKAKTYEPEGAEATKFLFLGLAAEGAICSVGKIIRTAGGIKYSGRVFRY